ncbi:hypothetical protein [Janthinobacterium sp. LB3P118]|uniref:hypothetical protein n=1 Tax=Janthinobacterium sp. LB3P118 TaxID=3424195 RepID=UPI003F20BE8C
MGRCRPGTACALLAPGTAVMNVAVGIAILRHETASVMRVAGKQHANSAAAALNANRQIGALVGVALIGSILHMLPDWSLRLPLAIRDDCRRVWPGCGPRVPHMHWLCPR